MDVIGSASAGSDAPAGSMFGGIWSSGGVGKSPTEAKLHAAVVTAEKDKLRAARATAELANLREVREGELQALRTEMRRL